MAVSSPPMAEDALVSPEQPMKSIAARSVAADPPPTADVGSKIRKGVLRLAVIVAIVALAVILLPGLDHVRHDLGRLSAQWLALAIGLEVLSSLSYILLFHRSFCLGVPWRISSRIGASELGVDSLIPAGGASGLALGAWVLKRRGMQPERLPGLSVAFFLLTSLVNLAAVIVFGLGLWFGVFPGRAPIGLTLVPAAIAAIAILFFLLLPRLMRPGSERRVLHGRPRRLLRRLLDVAPQGVVETVALLRRGDPLIYIGSVGYWAFDTAVLLVCFQALGHTPPVAVVGCAYLIGQLGGVLPLPLGIGGVDGGLIASFVLFGVDASVATAAVLAYRVVQIWVPAIIGGAALLRLRKTFDPRVLASEAVTRVSGAEHPSPPNRATPSANAP